MLFLKKKKKKRIKRDNFILLHKVYNWSNQYKVDETPPSEPTIETAIQGLLLYLNQLSFPSNSPKQLKQRKKKKKSYREQNNNKNIRNSSKTTKISLYIF